MDKRETSADAETAAPDPDREIDALETRDWMDSLDEVFSRRGPERVKHLLAELQIRAQKKGVVLPVTSQTPYVNTIAAEDEPPYPGDLEIEWRIACIVRWNAMAMVVRANRQDPSIGGHISTFASAATLYEVGYNHFFRGNDHPSGGDLIYIQGHASPGIYSRAFLLGRLTEAQLVNFRRELAPGGGLPSYPHPWLMPGFWEFPTVSMGLAPIMAIYQARFMRYLAHRGLKPENDQKVWAFLGDGETDEPESLGAITLASREKLDNLIFVVNCNLQRLDGPVRGNGKIVQELEAIFRGAGWNVIKVLWGRDWDPLFARDDEGLLARRLSEIVDGQLLKARVEGGAWFRKDVFGPDPRLLAMVETLSDDALWKLTLGGHDPVKVHAAYRAATTPSGAPTVILAQTIKGYGLGEAGEGRNITHQQKKLNEEELLRFRDRFRIPIRVEEVGKAPFYKPDEKSPEMAYQREHRLALGGYLPRRTPVAVSPPPPDETIFDEFAAGTGDRKASTTMVFVRLLAKMLRDEKIGKLIVPIVPDEARTFGMEPLFRQCGIYSSTGQVYEPVDSESLLYYRETKEGQILEEGITEAGAMSSFIAAGTAYTTYDVCAIPVFLFYSMFGFQRIGDLAWAAADSRCHGFLVGGTAGRTTLAGEGLQHQDGQSHLLALPIPNLMAYDPAFAYEIAVIVREGIRRMHVGRESVFYYLTVGNEGYPHPPMPEGADVEAGILKGMYRFRSSPLEKTKRRAQLLGSGAILNEVLKAQAILAEKYGVGADVFSVTSYKALREEALDAERLDLLKPGASRRVPYVARCFENAPGPIVAATDYVKAMPDLVSKWLPRPLTTLGTDGFGRSESRERLRDFFEVDARFVTLATLRALEREGTIEAAIVSRAIRDLDIDPGKGESDAVVTRDGQERNETANMATDRAAGAVTEFRLPDLGENVEGGSVLKVLVKPGDTVTQNQTLLEVETDKAAIEVPSTVSGTVIDVRVKPGDKIRVGDVALTVGTREAAAAPKAPVPAAPSAPERAAAPAPAPAPEATKVASDRAARSEAVFAAPSVRRLAREMGIDLAAVRPSGLGGRVSVDDVRDSGRGPGAHAPSPSAAPLPDFSKWGEVVREPMSAVRRKTAEHMTACWTTIPHVTLHDKADVTDVESVRFAFKERTGKSLTVTAILVRVVASALKLFPKLAASVDMARSEIVYKRYHHVGIAVDTERGLLVPVIRDADKKNVRQISEEIAELSARARAAKLSLEEMRGGTITITNLGGIGIRYFTPIVNHPEVAILGVGRAATEAVFEGGVARPRLLLPLSLSFDHRLIDGADGARALRWMTEALEKPLLIALEG